MTDDTLNVPGLNDDERVALNVNLKQLRAKQPRNLERSSLYDGKRAVKQVGTVIPPQYSKLGLALGWTAKGVDGLGRRCVLDKMIWTEGDLGDLGYRQLVDRNFLMAEIAQGRTDSLIHGVSYLITTRGDESKGEPAALVHAKDALNATGQWNTRKRRLDDLLSITSWKDGEPTGFVLYLDGVTVNAEKDSSGWAIDRSEHPWHVPADPLVYRPRASRRMGRSRITRPAISTQYAALRALVRLEAHMDIYAIPKLILLGAEESIFKNPDGSMKASWQIALGRAFGIPDDPDAPQGQGRADVKQFDAASPEPHLAHLNALAKLMAREMDLSDSDFALTDLANPTAADSYTEARESLIAEAEDATDGWSTPIRRSVTRALAIQNDLDEVPAAWASIEAKWRNPVHLSRAAAADAGAKQLGAVPWLAETEVGLELLGLDEQQIQRALAEKRKSVGRQSAAAIIAARDADLTRAAVVPADGVGA